MSEQTARLALPLIAPGQAQKEMAHNEALALIDAAVQANVAGFAVATPPADPTPGACWIVGSSPTGAWSGKSDALAIWTSGGWRFVMPTPGFAVWVGDAGAEARFGDDGWELGTIAGDRLVLSGLEMLAAPADAIGDPGGGATIDAEARVAIAAILAALRLHNLIETV